MTITNLLTSFWFKVTVLIVLLIIPLGYALYAFYSDIGNSYTSTEDEILILTTNIANQQQRAIGGTEMLLNTIRHLPEIKDRTDLEKCRSTLSSVFASLDSERYFSGIVVVEPNGFALCTVDPERSEPVDYRKGYPEVQRAIETNTFQVGSYYKTGRLTGKTNVTGALPIITDDGKTNGVLLMGMLINNLEIVLEQSATPHFVDVYVINHNGMVVLAKTSSDNKHVSVGESYQEHYPILWKEISNQQTGKVKYVNRYGETRTAHFATLEGGIKVLSTFTRDDLIADVFNYHSGNIYSLFGLLFTLLVIIFLSFLMDKLWFDTSLDTIIETVKKISDGDYAAKTGIDPSAPTLGILAEFIDKMSDTLEKKNHEIDLYIERVRKSNEELERFAYVASHDLQEPLRRIEAFSSLISLELANSNEAVKDYLTRLNRAAKRMRSLITDLLELSRVNTNKEEPTNVFMRDVINNVLLDLSKSIKEAGAQVNVENMPTLKINKTLIETVFRNLISNAIKFRRQEPLTINIWATPERDNGVILGYHFYVRDNGLGFSADSAVRVFEPFYRIATTAVPGTGMGLAIVKRAVEKHNGYVGVTSEEGVGSTFEFYLPCKRT